MAGRPARTGEGSDGGQLERTPHERAERRAHLQGRGLLAHRTAAEHREERARKDARRQRGRHAVVSAQAVDHRVGGQVGGQLERPVQQHGGRAEHGQQQKEPREARLKPRGQVHGERERDGGRGAHDAHREREQDVARSLRQVDAARFRGGMRSAARLPSASSAHAASSLSPALVHPLHDRDPGEGAPRSEASVTAPPALIARHRGGKGDRSCLSAGMDRCTSGTDSAQ